jgi:hypothetical protein
MVWMPTNRILNNRGYLKRNATKGKKKGNKREMKMKHRLPLGREIALYHITLNIYAPSPATTGTLGGGCDGPVPGPCASDGSVGGFRGNGSRWGACGA